MIENILLNIENNQVQKANKGSLKHKFERLLKNYAEERELSPSSLLSADGKYKGGIPLIIC